MYLSYHTPYDQRGLARMRRFGLDAIQLRVGPGFPLSWEDDDLSEVRAVAETLKADGVHVAALGFYRNMLDANMEVRRADAARLARVIRSARLFGTDVVAVFAGRDPARSVEACLDDLVEAWTPLVTLAEDEGVRLAFENCTMYRADPVRGINATFSPATYQLLFDALPSPALGVELDPSHLVKQRIDVARFAREFAPRVFHVHGKDHERLPEVEYRYGCYDPRASRDRYPGRGQVDFAELFSILHDAGYRGAVTLEGERDPDCVDEASIEAGLAAAVEHLRNALPR